MKEKTNKKKISFYLPFLVICCFAFWAACMLAQDRLVLLPIGYVAATIFIYPFVCVLLDIIAEIYGYKIATKTLWSCLAMLFILALVLFSFIHLTPPPYMKTYQHAFNVAFHPVLYNISIAWISIVAGQYINIYIISKLYTLTRGRFFALRSASSSIIGDTVTFVLCIWGFFINDLTYHQIFIITADELFIMFSMAIILSLPATLLVSYLKKKEPGYNELLDIDILNLEKLR